MTDHVEIAMRNLLDDPKYVWDFSVSVFNNIELYKTHRLVNGIKITTFVCTLDRKGQIVEDGPEVVIVDKTNTLR